VIREPGDDDARVRIDKMQLEQILLNLASNARDALPEGGTVRITVHRTSDSPNGASAVARAGTDSDEWVELRVADDGHGMDAETLARCLDPLFTTKQPGEGTGLGLSAVYGIAKQNGGGVHIESRPGSGTCVSIVLPSVSAATTDVDERPLPHPLDKAQTGDETILLVDDDHEIRWLVWRLLHERGYGTIVADTPLEAVDLMRRHAAEIDLLLTDVAMPGMSGAELARAVRTIRPIPVLFMSGYAEKLDRAANGDDKLLAKPFTPDELIEMVQYSLGHQASEPAETAQGSNR
jgi:CheY-like chemotaxis protein